MKRSGQKLENVMLLLSAGICIDKKDEDQNTALHYACELGHRNIAEVLLQNGACYELKNSNGMTAVDLASNQIIKPINDLISKISRIFPSISK